MRLRLATFCAAFATLVLMSRMGQAHLPYPATRAIESNNGKYVLVLLMSSTERTERREVADYDPAIDQALTPEELQEWGERVALQKTVEANYSQSGLYRNDGSAELLWPVPYLSTCRTIFVANDGIHVVAAKGMGSTCWDNETDSFVFYSAGTKIAGYDDISILPCYWMRSILASWAGIQPPYDESMVFNDHDSAFTIATNQGDELSFDLTTGKARRRRSPWTSYFTLPLIAPPVGYLLFHRRRETLRIADRAKGFGFSTRELFAVMTFVAGAVAIMQLQGWFGGACAAIALAGALEARGRWASTHAWLLGSIAAIYGCYSMLLACALIDTTFFDGWTLLRFWLDSKGSVGVRIAILTTVAVGAGWLAVWGCSSQREGRATKNPATS